MSEKFLLVMSGWNESDSDKENNDFSQPPKKKRAKRKKHFGDLIPSEKLESMSKRSVLINTEKNTKWALSTFREWISSRNMRCTGDDTTDVNILSNPVNNHAQNFVVFCVSSL